MRAYVVCALLALLSLVACGAAAVALIHSLSSCDDLGVASAIATLLSVVLAVVSIWYTYRTNIETQQLLTSIEEKNDSLVRKINLELRRDNFGKANIEDLESKYPNGSE